MTKIVRTPTKAEGGITAQEKERLDAHAKLWIDRIMRTDPIEPDKITEAIKSLYKVSGLKEPRVIIVPSPLVASLANGISSAVWQLRKGSAATSDATYAATLDATYDATYDATRAATDDATSAATSAATDDATLDATYAATDDATRAATYAATDAATLDATYDATYAATLDATLDATYDATRAATDDATSAATSAATDDATRAATDDAKPHWLRQLAEKFTPNQVEFTLGCVSLSYRMRQGGNMWAQYDSYLTAFRDILGLTGLDVWDKYAPWEQAAIHGGYRYMHEEYCIVSDFPKTLKVDEQNRPHCETGPSHEWRDGWSLYHLQGVRFEKEVWQKIVDGTYTIQDHVALENTDARAVALDMMRERNPNFIVEMLDAKLIHTGIKGTRLYRVDNFKDKVAPEANIPNETEYCMVMKHPSLDREYLEWVSRETGERGDADLAQCDAWTDEDGNPIPYEDYLLAIEA